MAERSRGGPTITPISNGWGGRRRGAGPKPKCERAGVSHRTRARFPSRFPVHVTLKLVKGVPSLRRHRAHAVLLGSLALASREGFRVVHYSAQSNHVHVLCEARDRDALWRGVHRLAIRVAKRLNRLWQRRGRVFADRYHDHVLRTAREVHNALEYVLGNARKHGVVLGLHDFDPFSSARDAPLAHATTWLLRVGSTRYRATPHPDAGGSNTSSAGSLSRSSASRSEPRDSTR